MTHIREKLAWALVATLGLFVAASMSGVVSGGPLDPPSPPASSPGGIDGRIPIDHLPFPISESGSYVVTRNLQSAGASGITVNADNVTIDLNGFTLDGVNLLGAGILAPGRNNLTVMNGVIRRYFVGIDNGQGTAGNGGSFHGLRVDESDYVGIFMGAASQVDSSSFRSNRGAIQATGPGGTIKDSVFFDNGLAISAVTADNLVESNHIEIPTGGAGIQAGDFATIRKNYFGHPSLAGYTTIQLFTSNYVVAIENRMKAGLTTGTGGLGLYIPYDITNPLTNLSP